MTVKLTPEYIETLIDAEEYLLQPEIIICKLTVGESVFVGEAHCFDTAIQNIERGKGSARRNAISRIFDAEAYHLKRERDKLNRQHGIHLLPIYEEIRKAGACIRLTDVVNSESSPSFDLYTFEFVSAEGKVKTETFQVDRKDRSGKDVQLQKHILTFIGHLEVALVEQEDGSEKVVAVRRVNSIAAKSIEHLPIVKEVRRVGGDVVLINVVGDRYTIAITNIQGMSHIQYISVDRNASQTIDSQLEKEIGLRCLGNEYTPQL